jgi:asparagine synthase (glutamine-hydrolysing)
MCGIIGISGQLDVAALRAGTAAIAHRGPDDTGVFFDVQSQIGLGHTRLSIVELSELGHQPMLSTDGQVVLVFNGEIYNFRELRAELELSGCAFRGNSDTEVVLQLYLTHGQAMLSRLNGIFAIGLWDARREGLLLARDALGVKPLYFYEGQGTFSFASELKALRSLMPQLFALNHAALHRYLSFQWCPGAETPSADVYKLGPGEALWVSKGRVEQRFTWYQLPVLQKHSHAKFTEIESVAGVQFHVRQAVQRQMIADVPVGAFLSGGLDSSSVVTFAREINPDIQCFTIEATGGQEAGMVDDLAYAKQVASHLKVPLEIVKVDSSRMAAELEQMVYQLDEPLADPAPLNVLYISRLAREQGYKVLLSGAGGDDIFSGYRRHLAQKLEAYWGWLPGKALAGLNQLAQQLDQRKPLNRRLAKVLNGAALEGDARLVNYFLWARREDLYALYTPAFKIAINDAKAEAPLLEFLDDMPDTTSALDRMLALEQRFFLPDHNLTYTDKMSMAVGVEVRVPLLDLDLVKFASQIPDEFKQRANHGKWVFKKAMEPFLPKNVIYRPKTGFGAPLRRWMRMELKELLSDTLSAERLKRRGLFEPTAVQRLIEANNEGRLDASYTLLSLLCIELWCKAFIDQPVNRSPSLVV